MFMLCVNKICPRLSSSVESVVMVRSIVLAVGSRHCCDSVVVGHRVRIIRRDSYRRNAQSCKVDFDARPRHGV